MDQNEIKGMKQFMNIVEFDNRRMSNVNRRHTEVDYDQKIISVVKQIYLHLQSLTAEDFEDSGIDEFTSMEIEKNIDTMYTCIKNNDDMGILGVSQTINQLMGDFDDEDYQEMLNVMGYEGQGVEISGLFSSLKNLLDHKYNYRKNEVINESQKVDQKYFKSLVHDLTSLMDDWNNSGLNNNREYKELSLLLEKKYGISIGKNSE